MNDSNFHDELTHQISLEHQSIIDLIPTLQAREYLAPGEIVSNSMYNDSVELYRSQKFCFLWLILIMEGYEK